MALSAALAGLAGSLAAHVMRELVQRGRPLDLLTHVVVRGPRITGYGYPSGPHHDRGRARRRRRARTSRARPGALAWIAVVLVAIARVYVGAHLPLDVVGGLALGSASARS